MAEILPFRAYRYSPKAGPIEELISPLAEIKTANNLLVYNSYNIQKLLQNNLKETGALLSEWKKNNYINADPLPALYVYYQYFQLEDKNNWHCRKGFICSLRIKDWDDKIILKHENIISESETFQYNLLENFNMFISPIHGLFSDTDDLLNSFMEESMLNPVISFTDSSSVVNKISVIQDKKVIDSFIEILKNKKIVLADGHHRYAAALRKKKKVAS